MSETITSVLTGCDIVVEMKNAGRDGTSGSSGSSGTTWDGSSGTSLYSVISGTSAYATTTGNAGTSAYASTAAISGTSNQSGSASYATTSGNSGTSAYSTTAAISGTSNQSGTSSFSTSAGNAGTSSYASTSAISGTSNQSGTSAYATTSGQSGTAYKATSAANAGSSSYATSAGNAGTAYKATSAGNAGTSYAATLAATDTLAGVVELATNTEALNGTDTSRVVTPDDLKYVLNRYHPRENLIGIPGSIGFGVGICPTANLPTGMTPMAGYDQLGHDNYGNYVFTDGSVMIWVPRFYYRVGHASNPTYAVHGVNSIDVKGVDTYATTALANVDGYALHRAFIDGGAEKLGFFRDKYMCSKVANGAGFTAASIKNGLPLSSAATHNPFSGLTGGADYYYSAIDLAHRRDGVDGAVNASSIFFCSSQFLRGAIAMLSMAHGQAATGTANCAWYHATYNYPKGCNNNALKDYDDTSVIWETDGYSNCGKTGSAGYGGGAGNVFAKSTHNGQNCGSADDNGLMYEISIGATCIATTVAIAGMSQAAACEITWNAHGMADGDFVMILAITQADWSGAKDKVWQITKTGDNTFTIPFNSSAFGTAYDPGADPGTVAKGVFYVAKEATAMKTFTHGDAGAADHWGATGCAAMMEVFTPPFKSEFAFAMKVGSGVNQVLSEALSGAGWKLAGLGIPRNGASVDATGTNLFGKDYFYQYVINAMCLIVAYYWNYTTNAGVWGAYWVYGRANSNYYVGFRAACYHV